MPALTNDGWPAIRDGPSQALARPLIGEVGRHSKRPRTGSCGLAFASLFVLGAFRNVVPAAQRIAGVNNALLPL